VRAIVLLALAACGPATPVVSRPVVRGGEKTGHTEAVAEAERRFAGRADEKELRAAIEAWRRAVTLRDDDAQSYLMLARASYLLADGFLLFDGRTAEAVDALEASFQAADRGLRARFPEYEKIRKVGGEVDQAALRLGKEAAPFLYWYALSLIRWADQKGRFTAARVYERVFRLIEMVRGLDPHLDGAGPDRFFGGARAEAPKIAGGSMPESRKFFERALALEPDYLENHLQFARYYANKAGDEKLFEYHMRIALEGATDTLPDSIPEQLIARKKAKAYAASVGPD
jgi:hypothetical protein